ncbi:hypothetical protein L195_g056481 [Trifolium pratense]|uniref:Uncharacterized protein n=1 Tax=Trifolium pratense TaxID=57577 RepID=A0A2K3JZZ7_TRIPR|nr:hypothetical protein L195_g051516 [Trifolium pratense]PNX69010.1 hypothetical protein L195_g056481 [Trifolium pratense]
MVPFASYNNTTSFIAAARYGRKMPLCLLNGRELIMGTRSRMDSHSVPQNFPSNVSSSQNSISSGVDLQGYANDFPNSSRRIFPNRRSLRYRPYRERLNRMNNSSIIGNCNPHPSVNTNNVQFRSHVTQEREIERHAVDIRETDAWTRPGIDFTLLDGYHEGVSSQKKELLLFKDEKNAMPTGSNVGTYDANDNEENLDLTLHL